MRILENNLGKKNKRDKRKYTWWQVSALERKIKHFVGGGSDQRLSRASTTVATRKFSSQDTVSLLGTHLDRALDFWTAPQGDPDENCDSPASDHVDSEPKGANTAFKKPYFGRRY